MEGNLIERRTSSAQLWSDARQQTAPTPSTSQSLTSTPVAIPAYSNIFVTPPVVDPEHRSHLVKMKEVDNPEIAASKLSQIKVTDKHDGEIHNYIFCFKLALITHIHTPFRSPYHLNVYRTGFPQWFRNARN